MTKMTYYLCTTENNKQEILYGSSKKQVTKIGEKMKLGKFKSVEEQKLQDLKKKYNDKELTGFRDRSKKEW